MARTFTAVLRGGPCDGKSVEIVGIRYEQLIPNSRSRRRFLRAVYEWAQERDGQYVGVFKGYWDGDRKVDRLGRQLPERSHHA